MAMVTTPDFTGRPASCLATLASNIGLWAKPGYMPPVLAIIAQHFLIGILAFRCSNSLPESSTIFGIHFG